MQGVGSKLLRIERIVMLAPPHDVPRPREMPDGAGVIEMEMRLQNVVYIVWLDTDETTLVDAVIGNVHHRIIGIDYDAPMPALG